MTQNGFAVTGLHGQTFAQVGDYEACLNGWWLSFSTNQTLATECVESTAAVAIFAPIQVAAGWMSFAARLAIRIAAGGWL
jgi:hypothetical protein